MSLDMHEKKSYTLWRMSREKKTFLEHVGGLRGLAIVLVVLFHLNGQAWAQGYLGVDVFLVITGYLLFRTRLAEPGVIRMREGGIYLAKRFLRIVPAMGVLIIVAVGVGAILLQPEDEVLVSRVGYAALLARANVFLSHEMNNYFAADTAFNPLLHLWYLAVALQVYGIYAVANQALQRLPKWGVVGALALLGGASLVWWACGKTSYYATLPRVWEVMAGGLVCVLPGARCKWATVAAVAGLLAVLLPALGALPAWVPLVVAGSVLALRYLPDSAVARALSNKPLLWLGKISFSVYLVHMPLIVFWRLWLFGEVSAWQQVFILAAAVLVGWGYWWAVEKRRFPWWAALLVWGVGLMLCRTARKTEGFVQYIPLSSVTCAPYEQWQECKDPALCDHWDPQLNPYLEMFPFLRCKVPPLRTPLLTMGNPEGKASVLLVGDSHAMCSYAGLNEVLRHEGKAGVYMLTIVLPFTGMEMHERRDLGDYNYNAKKEAALMRYLEERPQITHVIIAQRWSIRGRKNSRNEYAGMLRQFLTKLRALGRHAILVGPYPEYEKNNPLHYQRVAVLKEMSLNQVAPTCPPEKYEQKNKRVLPILRQMEQEGLCSLLEPVKMLEPGEHFRASLDDRLFMHDTNHLSPEGSIWMMKRLLPQLKKALE